MASQDSSERKADGNRSAAQQYRGGAGLNANGEDVSGSGSRPRRMTRGQEELRPQIETFSVSNDENATVSQPSHSNARDTYNRIQAQEPLQICPYHGTDRCEVDDPNWFDRRQSLFDHDYHPADSCVESTNRESHEPELRVRHHYRSYHGPMRVTNYRPAQVELHQENTNTALNAGSGYENVGLRGGALPGSLSESGSSSTHSAIRDSNGPRVHMSNYAEETRYVPHDNENTGSTGPNEQQSHAVMTEASRWELTNGPDLNNGSCIVIPEKCRCILRMVKDYGQPLQEVPTIWKTYCLEHNTDVLGRQPWQVYIGMHGSAPPPYQDTRIADPVDPRPLKAEPTMATVTMGLRGGAQPESDTDVGTPDGDDDWETTSGSGSDLDDNTPTERSSNIRPNTEFPVSGDAEHADEAASNGQRQDTKIWMSFIMCTHKIAHDMTSVAEELEKLNFGSDAPMTFGRCYNASEACTGSAPAASAPAKPTAPVKQNMDLKDGGPPQESKGDANTSRRIRRRRLRHSALPQAKPDFPAVSPGV